MFRLTLREGALLSPAPGSSQMVTSLLGVVLALVLGVLARAAAPVAHVDGFIGTTYFQDSDELGQTIPQVGVPFAHSPFTPDTTTVGRNMLLSVLWCSIMSCGRCL